MELLSLEEYRIRKHEFFKKYGEYLHKLVDINKRENQYMKENVPEGDAEDRYFEKDRNGKYYDAHAQGYEDERNALEKEYGVYISVYNADFGTILTQEAIDVLCGGNTMREILKEANSKTGSLFYENYGGQQEIYMFKYAVICPDDLYWYGEKVGTNEPIYATCVGDLDWLEQ